VIMPPEPLDEELLDEPEDPPDEELEPPLDVVCC
jgi:hypothetical protein